MATATQRAADLRYALIAKKRGMKNSLRIAWEARDAGVNTALAYAMVEQESGDGDNVFGHDPTASIPVTWRGTEVTKSKYEHYRIWRQHGGMQGVGPLQLTWWATQDAADKLGGTWVPKYNLRVGFRTLAGNIKQHGLRGGIRRYNGSGPDAEAYADEVMRRYGEWHKRLYGH